MKVFRFVLPLIITAFAFSSFDKSGLKLKETLQSYAQEALKTKGANSFITAVSLAAQCGDKAPLFVTAGTISKEDSTPIEQDSIFQIGSVTKSFIALVVLQIAEENDISIDDKSVLMKWFPEYPKWGSISLRELMNMTSGIPGNSYRLPDDIFKKFSADEYFNWIDPNKILHLTYQLPMHFEPGTSFEYSNTNYTLLGRFIKKVTGNDPEKEVLDRIIKKLALSNTYFALDKVEEIPDIDKSKIVHGYTFYTKDSDPYPFMTNGADTFSISLSSANTSGAMLSTPQDINIYLHALFAPNGAFNQYQKKLAAFVSRETGAPISAEAKGLGFGLGIMRYCGDSSLIYILQGSMEGFKFACLVDPKSQTYLVYAINSHADFCTFEDALQLFEKVEKSS